MDIRRIVPNLKASAPLERSRQFYEGVIGLELAMDLGWIVSFRSRSNTSAQLSVLLNDASAPVHPDVSLEVGDVDEVYRKAEAAGAEIVHPLTDEPWGVRRFFVRDPNGAVINVLAHLPAAG
jgi:catechol 2,3-dioxygenase-like lactoylglutathione lyase family enzyme